mmetsp:Transcript_92904/g.199241  ORF Transcript_92904/g.199241 Transcript_92904/m.199241 type:complete len:201 (+) Transcript_92904:95-697(+)
MDSTTWMPTKGSISSASLAGPDGADGGFLWAAQAAGPPAGQEGMRTSLGGGATASSPSGSALSCRRRSSSFGTDGSAPSRGGGAKSSELSVTSGNLSGTSTPSKMSWRLLPSLSLSLYARWAPAKPRRMDQGMSFTWLEDVTGSPSRTATAFLTSSMEEDRCTVTVISRSFLPCCSNTWTHSPSSSAGAAGASEAAAAAG